MRLLVSLAAVASLLGIGAPTDAAVDEAPDAYEIVTATAVPALPQPLRDFFEAHLDDLGQTATAGIASSPTPGSFPGDVDWHYVKLDIAAGEANPSARHAAARTFPRDRAAAATLFKRYRCTDGGALPWVIQERYTALVETFRTGDARAIVHDTGVLLHFATDGALPFNTTADRNGAGTNHLRWSAAGNTSRTSLVHRTVRHRCQLVLLDRLRSRLDYEVRVAPERSGPVEDPIDVVFTLLLDAHRSLEALLAIDAATIADLGITDAQTFLAASDAYYDRLADRAAPLIEARLEAGALLAAKLIGTAWVKAGSPSPNSWTAPGAAPQTQPAGANPSHGGQPADKTAFTSPSASEDQASHRFVGSRRSTIFHRAECSHARRIKPANTVYFETTQAARDAGRIPCKSCSPAGH